ncbi:GGDEF domain-containing protein [Azospirillum rugosum]|uniref:diguanylate cyclase n=1 Tax=Azospirillum rugosum TaxID=416170 RepID=A0ABS4SMW5_9PROT|nr:sensor domain-containing diguanylate cyclase [Azospirillum rugosum]MBP2293916.1 diguanylate cyclase (GGDEF)-like protein/PAS domain S-box-containing protein [Azospirillum rugosum]MDQ0526897.1 diguanylate cyclase (GGDEF)-like protein/PAS domain S-box-containing protein [Azospirillum rugosum]
MALTSETGAPALLNFFELDDDADAVVTSHELSVTRSKLGDLLDLLPAGLLIHQEMGIVFANQEAARILGLGGDALIGRHFLDFVEDADTEAQRAAFLRCLKGRELVRSQDGVILAVDGRRTSAQVSMSPLPWDGLPVIYVLINDVTALKESEERLRQLSITDPLTGVFNRRHFFDVAEQELARARRYGRAISLLALDIDHFKRINDTHGHAVGDEALRLFADACRGILRSNDLLGRMGGEEFAILLPETDMAGARMVAERIRSRTAELAVASGTGDVSITVSIGVSSCRSGERSVDAMLSCADEALYLAKAAGRNRVIAAADALAL